MNKKLLALYGLKFNPFAPDIPVEALQMTPRMESFCWRVEQLAGEGAVQGAVINEINKTPINNKSDYTAAVSALKSGQDVVVSIIDPRQPGRGNFYRGGTMP